MTDLSTYSSANDQVAAVRAKQVSARELLDLHLERIAAVNPRVNAIVSIDEERARASAAEADERQARGEELGPLHGLPWAFKDTHEVGGWRTTFGSPLKADYVPEEDEEVVARIRRAGAVVLGRTNVPEFASGSHTFNGVFGTTYNPYDLSRSAGGSSGGAAAALASGMLPLADGSDMGGSLRNPASFCNVVGLRPSLGRVPQWPMVNAWETTTVSGPLGRSVEDVALLLSVVGGPHPRVSTSSETPGSFFAPPVDGSLAGLRVALSPDLGGAFAVEPEVAAVVEAAGEVFTSGGAAVTSAHPSLDEAEDTFRTLRAWLFWQLYGDLLQQHPDGFKESLAVNIRAGQGLSGDDVWRGYTQRTELENRMTEFFADHDVLVMPVSQVPPFPADMEFPATVNGVEMEYYLDWMRAAYFISMTGCPAISVPGGFTPDGLPVGVQIVAPPRAERRLLEVARAFEQATGHGSQRPAL